MRIKVDKVLAKQVLIQICFPPCSLKKKQAPNLAKVPLERVRMEVGDKSPRFAQCLLRSSLLLPLHSPVFTRVLADGCRKIDPLMVLSKYLGSQRNEVLVSHPLCNYSQEVMFIWPSQTLH